MAGIERMGYRGFRFRGEERGGTSDRSRALSMRGQGGVRLHIGEGRYVMMTEADAALPVQERVLRVGLRRDIKIEEVRLELPRLELPKMLEHPELSFRVMQRVLPGASKNAGKEHAQRLNEENPGRKFRVPTEEEVLKLNQLLAAQLEGRNYWIWTDTEHEDYPGQFVLRRIGDGYRDCDDPGNHFNGSAARLVEYLNCRDLHLQGDAESAKLSPGLIPVPERSRFIG